MGDPELIKVREVLKHTSTMENDNLSRMNVKGVSNRKYCASIRSSTIAAYM